MSEENNGRGLLGLVFMGVAGAAAYWLSIQLFGTGAEGNVGRIALTSAGAISGLFLCVLYMNQLLPRVLQLTLDIIFGLLGLALIVWVTVGAVSYLVGDK